MTFRQKILKTLYPAFVWLTNMQNKNTAALKNENTIPKVDFFSLSATRINGTPFNFNSLKGKKTLIVNTASDCGYTGQYEELQLLYNKMHDKLEILAFPSNDFKEQEKGSNTDIEKFCKVNFGVTFPLMQKSIVKKGNDQNRIFSWLTHPEENGWNNKAPEWNFSKYIINESGILTNYFGPSVSPLGKEITQAITQ